MFRLASCLLICFSTLIAQARDPISVTRDPTQPQLFEPEKTQTNASQPFRIQSILYGPNRQLVQINGSTYRVGELVELDSSWEVVQISSDEVKLRTAIGNEQVLSLSNVGFSKEVLR